LEKTRKVFDFFIRIRIISLSLGSLKQVMSNLSKHNHRQISYFFSRLFSGFFNRFFLFNLFNFDSGRLVLLFLLALGWRFWFLGLLFYFRRSSRYRSDFNLTLLLRLCITCATSRRFRCICLLRPFLLFTFCFNFRSCIFSFNFLFFFASTVYYAITLFAFTTSELL